jgi:hypothetical protein
MDTRERSRHANWLIWSPAALALAALPSCAQGSRLWMASHRHDGAGTGNRRPAARRTGPDDVVFEQQPAQAPISRSLIRGRHSSHPDVDRHRLPQ